MGERRVREQWGRERVRERTNGTAQEWERERGNGRTTQFGRESGGELKKDCWTEMC